MITPGSASTVSARPPLLGERYLELIAPKLELVEDELRRNFVSDITTISEVGTHLLNGGGKRLRPILLLLAADMIGYAGRKDVIYAAVVEFIHTATLVHDDIIDEAAIRRGQKSVNYGWGNSLGVLVGDYLYMHAMKIALDEGNLDILRLLSTITIRMIEGEILGLEQNGSAHLTLDQYFDVAGRKTAALFGASCRIPAYLTNAAPEVHTALFDYGYNLGVCFQLIDDLLDVTSSTEVLGKPAISDLKEGKLTLPIILALPRATESERAIIETIVHQKSFEGVDSAEVGRIVRKYGGVERSLEFAREYADRARGALGTFSPSPAREALDWALDFVLSRDH